MYIHNNIIIYNNAQPFKLPSNYSKIDYSQHLLFDKLLNTARLFIIKLPSYMFLPTF